MKESIHFNNCCDCIEGCVLGEKVYCSYDGRFHPLRDTLECNKFICRRKEASPMSKNNTSKDPKPISQPHNHPNASKGTSTTSNTGKPMGKPSKNK